MVLGFVSFNAPGALPPTPPRPSCVNVFRANSCHDRTEEAGDRLELQVVDNGAGLADVTKALLLFSSTKSGHGLRQGQLGRVHPATLSFLLRISVRVQY